MLRAGALGRPRGMGWRGQREWGSGWGTHVNPWLIHVNVWEKSLQYCKVISLHLIKINEKKESNGKKEKKSPGCLQERLYHFVTPLATNDSSCCPTFSQAFSAVSVLGFRCAVLAHTYFNLHFPNDIQCGTSFCMFICCEVSGELSIPIFGLF